MRIDPQSFAELNTSAARAPRMVVEIIFTGSDTLRLASHSGISGIPGGTIESVISGVSGVSQQLNPDEARATIGSFSFKAIDLDHAITEALRERQVEDEHGLRDKRVRFLAGYAGIGFDEYQLVQTQRVSDATYSSVNGYAISCSDIQRELRSEIFTRASTRLSASITSSQTTIPIDSADGFVRVQHGPSYEDAPNQKVGYIQLSSGEIVRYTGTSGGGTNFTGCTRGRFGTQAQAITVNGGDPPDQRPEVLEFIYLEMPAIKIAWALLTGDIYGSAENLPDGWHLGIDPDDLVEDDFTGIGADLWDPDDDEEGFVARFTHLEETDGKRFLERELYLLAGVYSPVNSEGQLGLRRMTAIIQDAAYVATLDDSCIVSAAPLRHDMSALHNQYLLSWNWDGEQFTRETLFIDATSIGIHGESLQQDLEFRGLSASRHTTQIIQGVIDRMRDRYANPPLRLQLSVLGSKNQLEVGDIVRVKGAKIRDFAADDGDEIDRSMEIQRAAYDWVTGSLQIDVLGSSAPASIDPGPGPADPILADEKYTDVGTDLDSVLDIVGGVVQPGTYNLTGHANVNNAAARYFYEGDLEIGAGATITINNNVQLRIMGFLEVAGTIDGIGRGKAGTATDFGTPGYVGSTHGAWGILYEEDPIRFVSTYYGNAKLTEGQNDAFPSITIQLNASEDVGGIPNDLRGTSGGRGGHVAKQDDPPSGSISTLANGGAGGDSGAGLCIVCRGMDFSGAGEIDLSGDGSAATSSFDSGIPLETFPGAGGSGGPGALLVVLDGAASVTPDMFGHLVGKTGPIPTSGIPISNVQHQPVGQFEPIIPITGYRDAQVLGGVDISGAISRTVFLQEAPEAVEDAPQGERNPFRPFPAPDGAVLTVDVTQPTRMDWKLPSSGGADQLVIESRGPDSGPLAGLVVFSGREPGRPPGWIIEAGMP